MLSFLLAKYSKLGNQRILCIKINKTNYYSYASSNCLTQNVIHELKIDGYFDIALIYFRYK